MTIEILKDGRRYYLTGDTYAFRVVFRDAGCKWDPDRQAWWTSKKDVAAALFARCNAQAASEHTLCPPKKYNDLVRSHGGVWDQSRGTWLLPSAEALSEVKAAIELDQRRAIKRREAKAAERAEAKRHRTQVAQGEQLWRIPDVTDERIIRAFFGDRAIAYYYEVTHADFDRDDNQGPGHYCGIDVPVSLARRWDAGVAAAKAAGHKVMRSREALLIRYRIMVGDDAAELHPDLEALLADREAKAAAEQAAKDAAAKKLAEEKAAVESLLSGLVKSSVGPTAPDTLTVHIDAEAIDHHMASTDPGDCTFGGEGMARLVRGDTTYTEGRTADGQRVVREDYRAYDDYRTYYWAPAAVAKAWALAYARQVGITADQAREWLAQYNGCHGSDLYQAVVDAAEAAQ